ncbi:hypothetical protein B0T21DRAFT_59558 [Apiosordaria backusii]|uniref:Uncharacterized protein n=1 Tax=Apiosordaria backusii TaxID=314023 RepID=A0AA40ANH6_9PEZI|nr:hypothetical protein B0T21DRAFT_59558 [Apiosordaria backusii]
MPSLASDVAPLMSMFLHMVQVGTCDRETASHQDENNEPWPARSRMKRRSRTRQRNRASFQKSQNLSAADRPGPCRMTKPPDNRFTDSGLTAVGCMARTVL